MCGGGEEEMKESGENEVGEMVESGVNRVEKWRRMREMGRILYTSVRTLQKEF